MRARSSIRPALAALLVLAAGWGSPTIAADEEPTIGGVYELCIGVPDLLEQARYWQQFGYRLGEIGELDAAAAAELYGASSAVRSVRLLHQEADHGLIRLMQWEAPAGKGLGLAPMKVVGGRWGAMLTEDVYLVSTHAQEALSAGRPVWFVEPQKQVIYRVGAEGRPFVQPDIHVREAALIQPFSRQILFERFGYTVPLYGKVNESCHFPTSQVTHAGLVVQMPLAQIEAGYPADLLKFYEDGLGLVRRQRGELHWADYDHAAARNIFSLEPGERYTSIDFDDPRSVPWDLAKARSGRLKIIIFPEEVKIADRRAVSRPGQLGLTLYTYRVKGIEGYRDRVSAAGATEITPLSTNEFGERSFSFVSPDGHFWTLVE